MSVTKGRKAVEKKNVQLEKLVIEYAPIAKLKPNNYNPNRQSQHEFELLCRSIEEDGFTQPIIVSEDYTIVDGEHRWRAGAELKMELVPVVVVPMQTAQAKIATLRHNRARGSEDIELAVGVLRDLEKLGALDWAQDSLDISDAELNRLLADIPAPEALAADQHSEAWEPNREGTTATGVQVGESNNTNVDATPAAIKAARAREEALATAETEDERKQIIKDNALYGLSLSFGGEEAAIVKRVLGKTPAQTVLRLCQQADGGGNGKAPAE